MNCSRWRAPGCTAAHAGPRSILPGGRRCRWLSMPDLEILELTPLWVAGASWTPNSFLLFIPRISVGATTLVAPVGRGLPGNPVDRCNFRRRTVLPLLQGELRLWLISHTSPWGIFLAGGFRRSPFSGNNIAGFLLEFFQNLVILPASGFFLLPESPLEGTHNRRMGETMLYERICARLDYASSLP